MANIHIRRNTNSVDKSGTIPDNVDRRANSGDATHTDSGFQDTIEPNDNDRGTTGNDNIAGEPVTGNNKKYSFNPSDYEVDGGTEYINPTSATNNNETGRQRRRRSDAGIKRGTRARRTSDTQTTADLKSLLLTVHFGLAGLLHAPKMKLTEQEAETLSVAIKRVTDLYDVRIIPEKQMAWLNLTITAGCIYLPRFRKDKDKEQTTEQPVTQYYNPPKQPISIQEAYNEHTTNASKMKQ